MSQQKNNDSLKQCERAQLFLSAKLGSSRARFTLNEDLTFHNNGFCERKELELSVRIFFAELARRIAELAIEEPKPFARPPFAGNRNQTTVE